MVVELTAWKIYRGNHSTQAKDIWSRIIWLKFDENLYDQAKDIWSRKWGILWALWKILVNWLFKSLVNKKFAFFISIVGILLFEYVEGNFSPWNEYLCFRKLFALANAAAAFWWFEVHPIFPMAAFDLCLHSHSEKFKCINVACKLFVAEGFYYFKIS